MKRLKIDPDPHDADFESREGLDLHLIPRRGDHTRLRVVEVKEAVSFGVMGAEPSDALEVGVTAAGEHVLLRSRDSGQGVHVFEGEEELGRWLWET